ncbi:hypothetical protein Tco_0023842, partial [Tanacetum coccineum]
MVYTGDKGHELFTSNTWRRLFEIRASLVREFILEFLSTCRMSDTEMGLDVADTLCFQLGEAGFGAYWQYSERVIPEKGDHRDYWMEISSDRDFLGPAPLMGQAPEKVTGVDLFYFHSMNKGLLTSPYFGLVSDPRLKGLSVVTSELHLIDLHELGRINIYLRVGDTWAWVASGPERQPDAAAGALGVTKDAPAVDEGAQADPAPVQAPQP